VANTDRILTTHVGSMPRPQDVVDMLFAQDRDELEDQAAFDATLRRAVSDIVSRQVEAGVDLVSDGEMSKISYATYIRHRLSGFEIGNAPRATPKDLDDYPGFRDRLAQQGGTPKYHRPICTGAITVKDTIALDRDIANFKAALAECGGVGGFLNAASPGAIAVFQPNEYYPDDDAYLEVLAEAMRAEYEAIVAAGLLLQVDCPDLAMGRHIKFRDLSDEAFLVRAEKQIEALNHALANVPDVSVRMHVC